MTQSPDRAPSDDPSRATPPLSPTRALDLSRRAEPLGEEQSRLYRALAAKDDSLARLYLGAIEVLSQTENPDRLRQAAVSLRELITHLPASFGVPAEIDANYPAAIARLRQEWQRAQETSDSFAGGSWSGSIDDAARLGFEAVNVALEWESTIDPSRKTLNLKLVRALDGTGRPLPPTIEDKQVTAWRAFPKYFNQVLHRKGVPPEDEFLEKVGALERFMLEKVSPRVFVELKALDALIEEAERGT